ncbi:hypothetical protein PP1Y_AT3542 [Novosphingobium sp. PP1Y]|nr:hypothetical protein PP1Y_AT3542 [Novosphingobium sp. PP1Y]
MTARTEAKETSLVFAISKRSLTIASESYPSRARFMREYAACWSCTSDPKSENCAHFPQSSFNSSVSFSASLTEETNFGSMSAQAASDKSRTDGLGEAVAAALSSAAKLDIDI